jgi:hypothetical protein
LPLEQLDPLCKVVQVVILVAVAVAASMAAEVVVPHQATAAQVVAVHRIQRMPHLPL